MPSPLTPPLPLPSSTGVITRSATMGGVPPVIISADATTSSYSYGGEGNSSSGWFSGLKAKIAGLSGMSEWLSQLGIGQPQTNKKPKSAASDSSPSTSGYSERAFNENEVEALPGEGYDDDTGFSYNSIKLNDLGDSNDLHPLGWMDLDSSIAWNDTLEKQHFGPLSNLLTIGRQKPASGHQFSTISLLHPTWCDKCGDFIWGFMQQASKCTLCNYTCHERCKPLITLECRSISSSLSSGEDVDPLYPLLDGTLGTIPQSTRAALRAASTDSAPLPEIPPSPLGTAEKGAFLHSHTNPLFNLKSNSSTVPKSFAPSTTSTEQFPSTSVDRDIKEASAPLEHLLVRELYVKEDTPFEWAPAYRDQQLAAKIAQYNKQAMDDIYQLSLCEDGETFTGSLQIHMNFTRPINIVAGEKPPTVYDVVNTGTSTGLRTITSFFLPRNTVKTVTLNSEMTTRQMIVTLLRKFRVADNPRKFALYEWTQEVDDGSLLRKYLRISDDTCPLKRSLLCWGSPHARAYVLQENDTGDILWDAFEVPELENFLRILRMEEEQYRYQIQQKFKSYEYYLDAELRARECEATNEDDPNYSKRANETSSRYTQQDDPFGSCSPSSMIETDDIFHTMRPSFYETARSEKEEPVYVNIQAMGQSTKL